MDETQAAKQKQQAVEARGYIDELAAMVGSKPKVTQNDMADCVPGDEDSGKELIYSLRVSTEPSVRDRLLTEIKDKWESRGWTARVNSKTELRLLKGTFAMGASLTSDGTAASVGGGGGGCSR